MNSVSRTRSHRSTCGERSNTRSTPFVWHLVSLLIAVVVPNTALGAAAADASAPQGVVTRYCVTCHNTRVKTAGLALDAFDLSRVGDDPDVWERVVRKLRAEAMPPSGAP